MVVPSLWDLASRVNARRVLLWVCVTCVALLSTALFRNQVTQVEPFSLVSAPAAVPDGLARPLPEDIPLPTRTAPDSNPFSSAFLADLLERAEQMRREEERARQRAQEPPPKVVEATPPPVQGPPRPEAKLLYRGMFTRPDGTVLGLIENQRSNRIAFHRVGDQVEGLTIGTIARGALELIRDQEVIVTLAAGKPTSFQPDK